MLSSCYATTFHPLRPNETDEHEPLCPRQPDQNSRGDQQVKTTWVTDFAFDERCALETEARGYFSAGYAEREDGVRFPLCFYDLGRLAQDLKAEAELGAPLRRRT